MARRTSTTKATARKARKPADADHQPERITLVGRLCSNPVLRQSKSGIPISNLRLAVQDTEPTRFVTAVVFRRNAEVSAEYLRTGRLVEVTGVPRSREWVGRDGETRQTDEIVTSRVDFNPRKQAEASDASEQEAA